MTAGCIRVVNQQFSFEGRRMHRPYSSEVQQNNLKKPSKFHEILVNCCDTGNIQNGACERHLELLIPLLSINSAGDI
jgi:hypothetical protein